MRIPDRSRSALAIITRYVTAKHIDAVSIKVLLEQKKRKERIFEYIFEHFARGEKLQKYDEYKIMDEVRINIEKQQKEQIQKETEMKNRKKLAKIEKQKEV